MGRVRSIFDPAQTRPAGVGWKEEWPETDRRRQLVKLVLGSIGDRVCLVGFGSSLELQRSLTFVKKKKKKALKSAKSSQKNVKTHQICIKFAKICTKIAKICWEWLDLAKSHQIWLRTCWISLDLSLISPDFYITSVRSGGSGFGEENSTHWHWALGMETRNWPTGASVRAKIK